MAVLKNIVSKIFNLSTTPSKKTEGQFWYDTTNNVLKRSDGADYKPLPVGDNLISVGSTDTVKGILDSKANVSDLTDYLPLTGGTIARYEENSNNPILTIHDTQYGFGTPMAGLLVKGGMDNGQDEIYYSTYICPDEITGDAVSDSIISGSNKLLTSGGAYAALQNKQDKFTYVEEDTSIGNLYLGVISSSNAYITLAQDGGTMEISGVSLDITSVNPIKINSDYGVTGSAIVSTLGTSTTSTKLPTEGAVVKAISDVKTSLGTALTYEGSVENYSNLPTGLTASDKGKVYNVVNANGNIPAGTNYAWNGTSWDALGGDMSAYLRKEGDTSLELGILGTQQGSISIFSDNEWASSPTTLDYSGLSVCVPDEGWAYYTGSGIIISKVSGALRISEYYGFSGDTVDTAIPSTPEAGHIATTGAIKTYVDNSTSNKVEKNSEAELNAIIMPTYNSSGVQNGKAKIILYKDDTTGAITIEAEEIVE